MIDVNTNEKFLLWYLDGESTYSDLKFYGYKGQAKDYVSHLLYALSETSIYNETSTKLDGSTLTEEDYFILLVSKMNECL